MVAGVWLEAPELVCLATLDPQLRPLARPLGLAGGLQDTRPAPPVRSVRVDNYGVLTVEGASALLWDFGGERAPQLDGASNLAADDETGELMVAVARRRQRKRAGRETHRRSRSPSPELLEPEPEPAVAAAEEEQEVLWEQAAATATDQQQQEEAAEQAEEQEEVSGGAHLARSRHHSKSSPLPWETEEAAAFYLKHSIPATGEIACEAFQNLTVTLLAELGKHEGYLGTRGGTLQGKKAVRQTALIDVRRRRNGLSSGAASGRRDENSDTDSDSNSDSGSEGQGGEAGDASDADEARVARMRRRRERKRLWEAFGLMARENKERKERAKQRRNTTIAPLEATGESSTTAGRTVEVNHHILHIRRDATGRESDQEDGRAGRRARAGGRVHPGGGRAGGGGDDDDPTGALVGALFAKASVKDWAPEEQQQAPSVARTRTERQRNRPADHAELKKVTMMR